MGGTKIMIDLSSNIKETLFINADPVHYRQDFVWLAARFVVGNLKCLIVQKFIQEFKRNSYSINADPVYCRQGIMWRLAVRSVVGNLQRLIVYQQKLNSFYKYRPVNNRLRHCGWKLVMIWTPFIKTDPVYYIQDIVWPGESHVPPQGVPEKFHLTVGFLEVRI
jgi:hypothetical protein